MHKYKSKIVSISKKSALAAIIVLAIAIGYYIGNRNRPAQSNEQTKQKTPQMWTCSMDPQIKLPKPGKCPICAMDLIPLAEGADAQTQKNNQLKISADAAKRMELEVFPAQRRFVENTVRMVGHIDYDESRLAQITTWMAGRLDRLYVDYTGMAVRKGDHLVSIYSPQLLAAQEELLQSAATYKKISDNDMLGQSAAKTLKATREKLELLGLTQKQIETIESTGETQNHITIYSPSSGIVIEKHAKEGMYVQTGTKIYTIADLSGLWVELEAYESDLPWLRYGQTVSFESVAGAGEKFRGTVSFIDPVLDKKTRTAKIRLNTENADGKLKPGMFVKATVKSQIAAGGKVMDTSLKGKWICPMHPEIVRETADKCDTCQMPLERPKELGYATIGPENQQTPLVIPAAAAMITGKRAIVYVQIPADEGVVFEAREVTLGPRTDEYYIVNDGLAEGELVVIRGGFKIDSELQIRGRPSMMKPSDKTEGSTDELLGKIPPAVRKTLADKLKNLYEGYFQLQESLSGDQVNNQAVQKMLADLTKINIDGADDRQIEWWKKQQVGLRDILTEMRFAEDIQTARTKFAPLSERLITISQTLGSSTQKNCYLMHCPMAFDNRGARWLQTTDKLANPYFGSSMLRCGSILGHIEPAETK